MGPCGTPCLLGIAGAIVFLLGAITAVVACWRMNNGGKDGRRGRKYVESVSSLSGLQPDYTERTVQPPETLHLNFDMNRSITTNITVPKVMVRFILFIYNLQFVENKDQKYFISNNDIVFLTLFQ